MMAMIRLLFVVTVFFFICHPANGSIESWWNNAIDDIKEFENKVEGETGTIWKKIKEQYERAVKKLKYSPEDTSALEGEMEANSVDEGHSVMKKITDFESNVERVVENIENGCECDHYTCGCCQHLEEPSIDLNSTLCANATYLSEDIGISLTVTVNKYTIFNETVSVRNPPPVCLGVPYVKEWAEACLRLYDIDATKSSLHACAQVEARMKHILIAKYNLGCFTINPPRSQSNIPLITNNEKLNEIKDDEFEPHVMLV